MKKAKSLTLLLVDGASFYLSLLVSYLLRFGFEKNAFLDHLVSFTLLFLFWFLVFYAFQLYDNQRSDLTYYQNYFLALGINFSFSILLFYLFGPYFKITPKRFLLLFLVIFLGLNLFWRKRLGFVSEEKKIVFLSKLPEKIPPGDIYVVPASKTRFLPILEKLLLQGKKILSLTDYQEIYQQKIALEELTKEIFQLKSEQKAGFDLVKRIFDLTVALVVFLLSLPLWPMIILGIKISSPGKIFYRDSRVGFQEKVFTLYKFRTLSESKVNFSANFRAEKEARAFFFGKLLRKLHLDELPQLINIIKGDLSLVGPRPDSEKYYRVLKEKIPYYSLRTIVRPGITGWAQIKQIYGDSVSEAKERLAYDLYYIKHRSPIFDWLILLKTFSIFFRGR